jgi:Glyoxalase-like domain
MPLARWKDLCIDARRPEPVARFWADALDLDAKLLDDGDWRLVGHRPQQTVWINQVPDGKTVKNRVHLDLVRRSTKPLVALGGHEIREVMDGGETWLVVDDPDGAELCVFDSAQGEASGLVVDCADAEGQAAWWADVLHAEVFPAPDGTPRWLAGVAGLPFEVWKFVPVPESKTVKNRIHWDVTSGDVEGFVSRGATVLRSPDDEIEWHVLADREGNEFCVFAPSA